MDGYIPDNDKIFEALDKLYDEDNFDGIVKAVTKIPKENRSPKLWFRLIGAYSSSERFSEALRCLNEVFPLCKTNEEQARYWYQNGYIMYKTDHEFAARRLYQRGLEADPADTLNLKAEIDECDAYLLEDLQKLGKTAALVKSTLEKHCSTSVDRLKRRLSDEAFTVKLGFLPSIRRIPDAKKGFLPLDFLAVYSDKDKPAARKFLKDALDITDLSSLQNALNGKITYNLAMVLHNVCSKVAGNPDFEPEELGRDGQELFDDLTVFFSYILPFIPQKGGLAAWDISEKIGFSRIAFGCDLISENEYRAIMKSMANYAKENFSSFDEYLVSLVLGGATFMFFENNRSVKSSIDYINELMPLILESDLPDIMWNK